MEEVTHTEDAIVTEEDDDAPASEISEDSIEAENWQSGTIDSTAPPVVERIDLSGLLPHHDEPSRSSGYNSEKVSSAPKSTESGRTLMDQGNFGDAAVLLEAVYPMTFRQQLLLAECYLYTNQFPDVKVSVGHAARLMTLSLKLRIQDVSTAIKKALAKNNHVKALLLLHCSPNFAYLKMVPNDAVRFIERRVADYSHAVTAMVKMGGKSREYAEWFVTHNMLDILLLFREITKAKFEKKIDCEGRILTYFGLCYRAIDEHQRSLECFEQAMEVLNLTFDDRVMNSKLYGILLHNTGLVYESLNDYSGAESHYVQAYEALTFASDFESPKEKEQTVKVTETNLKILRDKMEVLALVEVSSESTDELLQVEDNCESTAV